jgi:hypothetical protein
MSQNGLAISCMNFGGFHESTTLDGNHNGIEVPFAVIPRCPPADYVSFLPDVILKKETTIEQTTGSESHEIIEAATDPFPFDNPAFAQTDTAHIFWDFVLGGGEVGDMCAQNPNVFVQFTELPYTVQRIWSNAAAAAGKDPCVPELPGEVYFNAIPNATQSVKIATNQGSINVKGVNIAVGKTAVVEIDLISEAATPPFNVQVAEVGDTTLTLALDRSSGVNGEKLHLSITVNQKSQNGFSSYALINTLGQTQTVWLGAVGY